MVPGFPELDAPYRSENLFPFFENRLMNRRRPERAEYLRGLGLDPDRWDPVSELAAPFNHAHGNGFEVYPDIVPDLDGDFHTQFVVHGLCYTNPHSIERTEGLEVGEELRISLELNNPATGRRNGEDRRPVPDRLATPLPIGRDVPRRRLARAGSRGADRSTEPRRFAQPPCAGGLRRAVAAVDAVD